MSAPPLVLHVVHHLVIGGMENGLVNLINHMAGNRYRHAIACVEDYSDFKERIHSPDVEVFALRRSQIGVWNLRRKLYRLCRAMRPAVVHTRNLSGLDALLPARLAGQTATIHGEHGFDVDNLDGAHWRQVLLRRLHSPLVDHYVAVSRDIERLMTHRLGIAPARVTQIYNGVDTERFRPAAERPLQILPPGFAPPEAIVVGTVGRAQAIKDQETLLRACAHLLANLPEGRRQLRMVIVGDGPKLNDLRTLASELGIGDLVWFAGATSDVPQHLQCLDLFVLASLNEGISNTILEAMACGLPVLASAVGGNVELVEEGVNGRLFAARDHVGLSDLLMGYFADGQMRHAHGTMARQLVQRRFSLDAMTDRYADLYDRVRGQ